METDAHWCPAGSTVINSPLEAVFSTPQIRYKLWSVRVYRPGCVHLGLDNIDKVGSIGIPGYRWSCKIVDENGNEVKQGEVGELCVKGPGVMTCYYNDPKATAETLKNGWLYTGDMAMQDEDGFYFLVDRKKDVIVSGGENIYPVQIENS